MQLKLGLGVYSRNRAVFRLWRNKQILQPVPRSGRLFYPVNSYTQLHATGRRCVCVAMIASWLRTLGKASEDTQTHSRQELRCHTSAR